MYLLSIYIVSQEWFLNKIPKKYPYLHKIILFYKNIKRNKLLYYNNKKWILLILKLIIYIIKTLMINKYVCIKTFIIKKIY